MLHSLQPEHFVVTRYLRTPWKCLECEKHFRFGNGVMSLAHFLENDTGRIQQGLMCFCSTKCLLRWEHPTMLGGMN